MTLLIKKQRELQSTNLYLPNRRWRD